MILVQNLIHEIRGKKVMLDFDLARLYQVETKVLNQAVRRNIKRFPLDFMFQLDNKEFTNLKSQIVTSSWGGRRTPPLAFTEEGIAMLASVLHSDVAIADLSSKLEEKKSEPRRKIGFQQNIDG